MADHPLPPPAQRAQSLNLLSAPFIHFAQTLRGGRQREDVVLLADVMEDVSGSRPQFYIRDTEGREVLLKFELDTDASERKVFDDVAIGGMVALRNPHVHHFMDGSVGLRVEEDDMLGSFKAFGCSVEGFRKFNERLMYTTRHPQCEHCGTLDGKSQCSGCQCTRYCSRDCQQQNWRTHQHMCRILAALREFDQAFSSPKPPKPRS